MSKTRRREERVAEHRGGEEESEGKGEKEYGLRRVVGSTGRTAWTPWMVAS